jgi:hypothetical protein
MWLTVCFPKEFFLEDETQDALDAVARRVNAVEATRLLPMVLQVPRKLIFFSLLSNLFFSHLCPQSLLRVMSSRSNGSRPCEVLMTVLTRVARELGTLHRPRQGLLQTYVEYGFNGMASTRFPVHFSLCASFLVVLMMRAKVRENVDR